MLTILPTTTLCPLQLLLPPLSLVEVTSIASRDEYEL